VVLWCSEPRGAACLAASRAFGTAPVPLERVPAEVLDGAPDLDDDCTDPALAPALSTLARAVGIDPSNWHDNVGQIHARESISDIYSGSGCTNCCWADREPPVKLQAFGRGRVFVRVWETGDIT
jgi:hypothetical protein